MKTIMIRLPDVEAAMLQYLKVVNRDLRDLEGWSKSRIREEYLRALPR